MNRIVIGDNLAVMRGMPDDSLDLIYLDPPFNSNRTYSAPIGSETAAFKDTWTLDDVDHVWLEEIAETSDGLHAAIQAAGHLQGNGTMAYLVYMAVRLLEMKRLLKDTGSVYLHCDPTASHYLKLLMDGIFGAENFRNEVIWSYRRWPSGTRKYQSMHDCILFYAGNGSTFNIEYEDVSDSYRKRFKGRTQVLDPVSKSRKLVVDKPTKGLPRRDVWELSILAGSSRERNGYPTQKPLALLERIIKASSNEGDTVLDPFCGSGTTLVAADKLNRKWIGIDISPKAGGIIDQRMKKELGVFKTNYVVETVEP